MSSLLKFVLEAHGGLHLWNRFSDLVTDVEVAGPLCERKRLADTIRAPRLILSLREQRVVVLLPDAQSKVLMAPGFVSRFGERGIELERLVDPGATIRNEGANVAWDVLRGAYFVGYAVWHYATAPFLYTFPGFGAEEVEPWYENGEIWRVLRITFPSNIETHSRVQYAFYGGDGLLRRQRYRVDVLGGLEAVNYATSYENVNGIRVATSRDVFECDRKGYRLIDKPLATIRLRSPFFTD